MDRLLAVNAEYKRQAIEYSNRIDDLEQQLADAVESQQIMGQELFNARQEVGRLEDEITRLLLVNQHYKGQAIQYAHELEELKGGD